MSDVHYLLKLAVTAEWQRTSHEKLFYEQGLDFSDDDEATCTLWWYEEGDHDYVLVRRPTKWVIHHFQYLESDFMQELLAIDYEKIN